jgi:hypothetical protein
MSKQHALLETLLGAAELNGNRIIASNIRDSILKLSQHRQAVGYERLARAASQPKRPQAKAA